jgi:3-methyladenine DNA glycosylase/8-oxoguanine DNA glycosylase
MIRLRPVYSREAVDRRAKYQYTLTPEYRAEQALKREAEDRAAERKAEAIRSAAHKLAEVMVRRRDEPSLEDWTPVE